MTRRVLLALAITIAMVSGGAAQNNKPSALDEVFNFGPKSVYTADFRAKFAQTLSNYCREVLNALPTNTPAEDNWVASEENTRDGAKLQCLFKSKEYSRSFLKSTFSDCKDKATLLIELEQLPEKETETFSRLEAGQFIKLALILDVYIEPYSSNIEMNREVKLSLDDLHLHVIRHGLLRAAQEALQDVHWSTVTAGEMTSRYLLPRRSRRETFLQLREGHFAMQTEGLEMRKPANFRLGF